jgi:hypothetical protein
MENVLRRWLGSYMLLGEVWLLCSCLLASLPLPTDTKECANSEVSLRRTKSYILTENIFYPVYKIPGNVVVQRPGNTMKRTTAWRGGEV